MKTFVSVLLGRGITFSGTHLEWLWTARLHNAGVPHKSNCRERGRSRGSLDHCPSPFITGVSCIQT